MIPESTVRAVVDATRLSELIGEYVSLKKAGGPGKFKGLCPFHGERTPSFHVIDRKGFYHCFGCSASGDAIKFLREHDGLTFVEAVELLGNRAGIEVAHERSNPSEAKFRAEKRDKQAELRRIADIAQAWFHAKMLHAEDDSAGRKYLDRRGINMTTVQEFGLGIAPDGWAEFVERAKVLGLDRSLCEELGLILPAKNGGGHYDRFRRRLIFPVYDLQGRPVGFGGRAIPRAKGEAEGSKAPPKYINSPDSVLYTKGDQIYGLKQAKRAMRAGQPAIIVEGNIDVAMMYQSGFESALAPMGTALTIGQVRLIRRFTDRFVLMFDPDGAGQKAARAAAELLLAEGVEGYVVTLPGSQDPADILTSEGGTDTMRGLLQAERPLVEYLVDLTVRENAGSDHGAARAIEELAPLVRSMASPTQRDLTVRRIAFALGYGEQRVARLLEGHAARQDARHHPVGPTSGSAPGELDTRELPQDERAVVAWCLMFPMAIDVVEERDGQDAISHDGLRQVLWEAITLAGERGGDLPPAELLQRLEGNPLAPWVGRVLVHNPTMTEDEADEAVARTLATIMDRHHAKEVHDLAGAVREAVACGDDDEALERLAMQVQAGRERMAAARED